MRLSVIITTYNRPYNLIDALESVLQQTKMPDEIIIIDDASEIDIKESIKSYLKKNTIKIYFHRFNENKGACAARNFGAKISTGDILMFLDDDDTWEPNKIENQMKILINNPEIGLVYTGRLIVYSDDRDVAVRKIYPKEKGKLYPKILYKNYIGPTSAVAIRKSVFKKTGGFDENLPALQDYDLWIRACKFTLVDNDGKLNVRYTIANKARNQISGRSENHIKAVYYVLNKYRTEINSQGILLSRKIKSEKLFDIVKAQHKSNYLLTLPWILKCLLLYPNIKVCAYFLPSSVIKKIFKR